VDPAALNRDPARVKEYVDDPLNAAGALPARTGNESLKAFRALAARHAEFALPVYAHHGTQDRITSLPATR
jgi:acylglycerol lipase